MLILKQNSKKTNKWKALLGQYERPEATAIRALGRGLEYLEYQKIRLEKKLGRNLRSTTLLKPPIYL